MGEHIYIKPKFIHTKLSQKTFFISALSLLMLLNLIYFYIKRSNLNFDDRYNQI